MLEECGVIINDLGGSVSRDIYRYIREDNVHLTEEGIELCAKQTAKVIFDAALRINDTGTKCDSKVISADTTGAPVLI